MAIMNCRKMPTSVVYRSFRSCGQSLKPGEANRSNAFKKTNNLQHKNDQSSSSRRLVCVPKPSTAVRGVPTKSSKRRRCSEDDFEAVGIKGLERKDAKRQRTSTDIEDARLGHLDSKKVDGGMGLPRSSELCSSTYSGNSLVTGSRVAMLLTRFGDILKARRDTVGETKGLETTEAKIASLRNAETNRAKEFVMQQRQQDREAARVALDEVERNADIEDNFKVMKEIQTLLSGQQSIEFRKYFRLLQD